MTKRIYAIEWKRRGVREAWGIWSAEDLVFVRAESGAIQKGTSDE